MAFSCFGETVDYPSLDILKILPENIARRYGILPLFWDASGRVVFGVADPEDEATREEIRAFYKGAYDIRVIPRADLMEVLEEAYGLWGNLQSALVSVTGRQEAPDAARASPAPIVALVDRILARAIREGASDVHVEAFENASRVRFRVDGVLRRVMDLPSDIHPPLISRIKILAGMDIAERRKPQDGKILLSREQGRIDVRVSTLPSIHGEKLVLRLLDAKPRRLDLETLGFLPAQAEVLRRLVKAPHGMILLTGPTGSGKTTTLYALLDILNEEGVNIVSVEDPIEYTIEGVTQVQINERAELTFARILRSILRQDPDKIMVGEIRDAETAQIAARAALTGHLVLSTLHTNDALSSVTRLIDMGLPPFLVGASLIGCVAQRLVRVLCDDCKREVFLEDTNIRASGLPQKTYRAQGCLRCRYTGYRGRACVAEVVSVTDEMRERIGRGAIHAELLTVRDASDEVFTLRDAALAKVAGGVTSLDEVVAVGLA